MLVDDRGPSAHAQDRYVDVRRVNKKDKIMVLEYHAAFLGAPAVS
jgi:hypothetical protein